MKELIVPAITATAVTAILIAARGLALGFFHRWAERTETKMDDIIVRSLRTPSLFWCVALGLYAGIETAALPVKQALVISRAINVIIILSVTIAVANLSGRLFKEYIRRADLPLPATGLVQGILKGSIIAMGVLITLSALGISITPLITALGVGGLAVALALQDTLSNLFAGIHILMEKSVRVGDFIRLESGQEGVVTDITWRTTRVRMLPNNVVVIPNNKLAQSVVTNYNLPDRRMAVVTTVGVAYGSDTDLVERTLDATAREVRDGLAQCAGDEPIVRLSALGLSSLEYSVILHVHDVTDQYAVQHALRTAIVKNFRNAGIEIPFPQTVVHLRSGGGVEKKTTAKEA